MNGKYLLRIKWKLSRSFDEFNSLPPEIEGTYYYESSSLSVVRDELSAKIKLSETKGYERTIEDISIYERMSDE